MTRHEIPSSGKRMLKELCEYLNVTVRDILVTKTRKQEVIKARSLLVRYLIKEQCFETMEVANICNLLTRSAVNNLLVRSDQWLLEDVNMQGIYYRSMVYFKPLALEDYYLKTTILQMTLKGRVVKKWPSVKTILRIVKISQQALNNALSGRTQTAGGYKWKYE